MRRSSCPHTNQGCGSNLLCLMVDNSSLSGGPLTWEIIRATFLDCFFPREMRENKVTVFTNLRQGGKSVHEYSLEFIIFSKYEPSLVSDLRDQMSHFMTRVFEELQEEFQSSCYMTT